MLHKPNLGPGLCECGCGQTTKLSPQTAARYGWVKGQPRRFVLGHDSRTGPAAFWSRVPDHLPEDACWPWQGARTSKGYGSFNGQVATRLVYEALVEPIPEGRLACHTCDNPPCVNPAHIFLGTNAENMADMVRKGRRPAAANRKFTDAQVAAIRAAWADGASQASLKRHYGVSPKCIRDVVYGRSYREVGECESVTPSSTSRTETSTA